MKRKTLYFTAPEEIELREEPMLAPAPNEVLVETLLSAISAGTEMLVYRGRFQEVAETFDKISAGLHYPVAYGYACIGRVIDAGSDVERAWIDRQIFSFQPHTSHFIADPATLLLLPPDLSPESACFLPSMETAVNLVQDAAPILGEAALVLGQGVIGLLTTALLKEFPLQALVTADNYPLRRKSSADLEVTASLDPKTPEFYEDALSYTHDSPAEISSPAGRPGFDLTFELSGNPAALNDAISLTKFSGRIMIGSWYGQNQAPTNLGGSFHRSRIRLISSQVSTIAPELSARWDKRRRFAAAWNAIRRIKPEKWVTHRIPFSQAGSAYKLLDASPAQTIQIIFNYP